MKASLQHLFKFKQSLQFCYASHPLEDGMAPADPSMESAVPKPTGLQRYILCATFTYNQSQRDHPLGLLLSSQNK